MSIFLTWTMVEPFLSARAKAQRTTTEPWLAPLQVVLNQRYGDHVTQEPNGGNEPLLIFYAAEAVNRRTLRPADAQFVDQQSVAGASVRYNSRAALSRWFEPEELDQMDEATGVGNITSKRTPAPDAQRFGNRMRGFDEVG